MWGDGPAKESSEEEEEESSEEESSEDEVVEKAEMTREERKAAAKARKEAAIARQKNKVAQPGDMPSSSEESEEDDMPANPNHSKAARSQASNVRTAEEDTTEGMSKLSVAAKKKPVGELSRREREALQAQQAKERYQKLHEAGKTDEAKADLARLKLIRERREAEAARKQVCTQASACISLQFADNFQAEKEEREEAEKTKKAEIDAKEAKKREAALGPAKKGSKSKK